MSTQTTTDAHTALSQPRTGVAFAALLAGATCIALSPIFVRLSEAGPTATAFWRVALAVPLLWLLRGLVLRQSADVTPVPIPAYALLAAGVAFAGDLAFWHISIKFTSVANSTLLANLAVLFVTLAVWVLHGQKPTRGFTLGLTAALIGIAMLVASSVQFSSTALLGDLLGVMTAMFYAWYILSVKRLRDAGVHTLHLMAVTTTITAVLLLPVALLSGETRWPQSLHGWGVLLGIAWISHTGGQSLIAWALAHLPAAFSSVSLLLQPVLAGVFAWTLLAEPLSTLQIVGGMIVLIGIALARRASV